MKRKPTHSSGSGIVLPKSLICVLLFSAVVAPWSRAQPTGTRPDNSANPSNPGDQVVQMSNFVVRTTQGLGYVDANAATALKTNQSLLDIPQGVLVFTNDLISDIGSPILSDTLQYAGVNSFYRGNTDVIRGSRSASYIDDMIDSVPYEDDVFVDSIEVVKGPTAVLYPSGNLSGTVLKASKKPLQHVQDTITFSVNQWGLYRGVIDFTGPVGNLGDARLGYRLVAALQRGDDFFTNLKENVDAIHPTLELDYKNTTVLLAYDYQKFLTHPDGDGIITPRGTLYTGAGFRYSGGWIRNGMIDVGREGVRASVLQKFSDSWESKFSAQVWTAHFYGSAVEPDGINWQTGTIEYVATLNNQPQNYSIIQDDVSGKFELGMFKNQSNFGFSHTQSVVHSEFWTTANPDVFEVPMNNPAAFQAVSAPPISAYTQPANPGTRTNTYREIVYYQHQLDIVPNLLTVVAGYTYAGIETVTDSNIAFNAPYASTDRSPHQYLRRLGGIVHLTKDISVYALDSTTFTPTNSVDVNNNVLPNVVGIGDEVGVKTALWDGRITSTFSAFRLRLTNQAVFSGFSNPFGNRYFIPIGSTTTKGWDGDMAVALLPGWQMIITMYNANIADQNGNPASNTFGNSWSLFTRYDFAKESALKGLAFGGGVNRIGKRLLTTSGVVFPVGFTPPALFKLHEGTPVNLFAVYDINRHWQVRLNAANLLNSIYPVGAQAAEFVDPEPPQTFTFSATYKF